MYYRMPKLKLTKRNSDAVTPTCRPCYYFDTELPGFFLRVMPSGVKAWGFEYRAGSGRSAPKRRTTIASFGKLTAEQARSEAKRLSAQVTSGYDPAGRKSEQARELTVAQLVDLYELEGCVVQRGSRQGQPMKERTKKLTLARLRNHVVPLLGRRKLSDLTPGDVEKFVSDVSRGKTSRDERVGMRARIIVRGGEGAARKVVRDLSAVLSFATRRGLLSINPCATAAVRKIDNKRQRYLNIEEITNLGTALEKLATEGVNPKALDIVRLWALTGCRRDEIAALKWSEVDLDNGLLVLDDSKTGKSVRPLATAAVAVLSKIERHEHSRFVFPAERGAGHYQGTKKVWPRIVARANLSGVTPHTLRHTVGSTAVSSGEALPLTGAILGHSNARSTSIYAHVQHDPSKRVADRVAQTIAAALRGERI